MKHNFLFIFLILLGLSVPIMYGMKKKWWKPFSLKVLPSVKEWFGQTIFNIRKPKRPGSVKLLTKHIKKQYQKKIRPRIEQIQQNKRYQKAKEIHTEYTKVKGTSQVEKEIWRRRKKQAEEYGPKAKERFKHLYKNFEAWKPRWKINWTPSQWYQKSEIPTSRFSLPSETWY